MAKRGISVIMPVYNAGGFLEESLKSVLNQTFTDFELICVNDASDDMSAEILQRYANTDDRINILTNSVHKGAAESRNWGLAVAKGIYLSFLDADDIFEPDMLEQAYETIEKHQADVVIFEYMQMPTERIYEVIKKRHSSEYKRKYCEETFYIRDYTPNESMKWTSPPWNKLYRHSFIQKNKLEFQTLSSCNDAYFVEMAIMSQSKLIALNEERAMVHVREHDSVTRISHDRDPMCIYEAMEKVQKELIARKLFGEVYEHFYYRTFYKFIWALQKTKNRERAYEFYNFLIQYGIRELCECKSIYYEQCEDYIRSLFKRFEENSFESQWYMKIGELSIYLENKKGFFIDYIKRRISDEYKICIFGGGRNGKVLIDFFDDNELPIESVLDMDEEKEGSYISGNRINSPNSLLHDKNEMYLVIVSTIFAIDSANDLYRNNRNNITVVSIHELLDC